MLTWHEARSTGECFGRIVSNPRRNSDRKVIIPQNMNFELTIGKATTPEDDESGH